MLQRSTHQPSRQPRTAPTRGLHRPSAQRPVRGEKAGGALAAVLASGALARLATYFAACPDEALAVRDLARRTGLTARSITAEIARLTRLGIVRLERDIAPGPRGGRAAVRVRLVQDAAAWIAVRRLVGTLVDPLDLLRVALARVPGVVGAFCFGSVAASTADASSDLDLFVVFDDAVLSDIATGERGVEASVWYGADPADPRQLRTRAAALAVHATFWAGLVAGREIDVVAYTAGELAAKFTNPGPGHAFVAAVFAGPTAWVLGADVSSLAASARTPMARPYRPGALRSQNHAGHEARV